MRKLSGMFRVVASLAALPATMLAQEEEITLDPIVITATRITMIIRTAMITRTATTKVTATRTKAATAHEYHR